MRNVRITIVHYQHPAAVRDLKEWEILFWDKIVYKCRIGADIMFILFFPTAGKPEGSGAGEYEVVYCTLIPSARTIGVNEEVSRIRQAIALQVDDFFILRSEDIVFTTMVWNKHVIYGSTKSQELYWLANFQEAYQFESHPSIDPSAEEQTAGRGEQIAAHGN